MDESGILKLGFPMHTKPEVYIIGTQCHNDTLFLTKVYQIVHTKLDF